MPWVESPFFEELLTKKNLSPEDAELARTYHRDGFLVLSGMFDETLIDQAVKEMNKHYDQLGVVQKDRALNLWQTKPAVKQLASDPKIMDTLQMLYGRRPIPFQTLNFKYGSQQRAHSDSIHFQSMPQRYLAGVWVALEETNEDNGTLQYYPGSQRWPIFDYSVIMNQLETAQHAGDVQFYEDNYETFMEAMIKDIGAEPEGLRAKKGDVIIWAANLVHGGLPIRQKGRTRFSQVTHYFFEDCLYYNPSHSNIVTGEWSVASQINIATGQREWGSYNGQKVPLKKAGDSRYLISRHAPKNWRDLVFLFQKAWHKVTH